MHSKQGCTLILAPVVWVGPVAPASSVLKCIAEAMCCVPMRFGHSHSVSILGLATVNPGLFVCCMQVHTAVVADSVSPFSLYACPCSAQTSGVDGPQFTS